VNNNEIGIKTTLILAVCGIGILFSFLLLWIGFTAIYSEYHVWSSGLAGEAELKQAEWNRQITVREAQAKKDSAVLLADAEVERAKGVAKANTIIGESLNNNESYLRYLWIQNLQNEKNQIIYVPTETNLPILEANRFKH
jgi:regulator of protease activity HflC (stomatin/prohibitin superfamily)